MKKNIAFAGAAVLLGLLAVEGISFLALKALGGGKSETASKENAGKGEKLAETIRFNLEMNPLTSPDPELIFRVRPNPSGKLLAGYEGINSRGFRGGEPDQKAETGELKILIVGDSCGFGWGLTRYGQTWPSRLEEILRARNAKARVYNLSQPGYSSRQASLLFDQWFARIKPDYVIIYLGWNDIWSTPGLTDRETLWALKVKANPLAQALFSSHSYELLKRALAPLTESRKRKFAEQAGYGTGGVKSRVPLEESVENIGSMITEAEKEGARPIIVLPPYSNANPELYPIERFNGALLEAFINRAAFAGLAAMRGENPGNWRYFTVDGFHANAEGSELIAYELAEKTAAYSPGAGKMAFGGPRIFPAFTAPSDVGKAADDPSSLVGAVKIAEAPAAPAGALVFGPSIRHECLSSRALFRMKTDRIIPGQLASIDAASEHGRKIYASRPISGAEFEQAGQWKEFEIAFNSPSPIEGLELRAEYLGGASLAMDYVKLVCEK